MLDRDTLRPHLARAMGRALAHARGGAEPPPPAFADQAKAWARAKSERGRAALAQALALKDAEFGEFDAAVAEAERAGAAAAAGEQGAARRALLAELRLLSWLETVGQRVPVLAVDAEADAAASEDLGRKQVRAMELVVRGLIAEAHGGEERLLARLREAVGEEVVRKWQAGGDPGDVLSGCTFSDLASLFASTAEFARWEPLWEGTPFLTLLRQRRRTLQAFLDDVRRVRNALAHNRKVTHLQLSLLDLYYEEIVGPVEAAHAAGSVRTDPKAFLGASRADLDAWQAGLREDLRSVKDDLAALRSEVLASVGAVREDTAAVRRETTGLRGKVVAIGAGVAVLLVAAAFLILQGKGTREQTEAARGAAERTEDVARRTAEDARAARDSAAATAEASRDTARAVETAAGEMGKTAAAAEAAAMGADAAATAADAAAEEAARTAAAAAEAAKAAEDAARAARDTGEKVVQTLEEVRAGFAALAQTGGVIADPKRPQEHYHNARLHEQRGDMAQAMRSYRAYFASGDLEFVDPHLRFQAFLKLQEGAAGAREAYFEMKRASRNPVVEFAWALLLEPQARSTALGAFVEAHPDFAPAWYEWSRDASAARLGTQSADDKREEKERLARFLALQREGPFLRHYLDQAVAAAQVADAEERMAALSSVADEALANPVRLSGFENNAGWTLVFSIADTTKEVFWRTAGQGPFRSTGFVPGVLSHAGLPLPQTAIEMPRGAGKAVFEVKYLDPRGREHGPYSVEFDPDALRVSSKKHMLGATKNAWLSFRDYDGKTLLYFTIVLAYRSVLKEIRYGVDAEAPDRSYPIKPADPANPDGLPEGELGYLEVPASTKFATIQLFFTDGSSSEVVRIAR